MFETVKKLRISFSTTVVFLKLLRLDDCLDCWMKNVFHCSTIEDRCSKLDSYYFYFGGLNDRKIIEENPTSLRVSAASISTGQLRRMTTLLNTVWVCTSSRLPLSAAIRPFATLVSGLRYFCGWQAFRSLLHIFQFLTHARHSSHFTSCQLTSIFLFSSCGTDKVEKGHEKENEGEKRCVWFWIC